jgi:cytochrome c1
MIKEGDPDIPKRNEQDGYTVMPDFPDLSDQDMDKLIAYLNSL